MQNQYPINTKTIVKALYLGLVFAVIALPVFAQLTTNYNDIIHPDIDSSFIPYEERLIQIAYRNYPQNRIYEARYKQAESGVTIARLSWFNNLTLTSQYYSQLTPGKTQTDSLVFFPRLGVGFTINVGGILSTPAKIRQAKQEVKVAQANMDAQKLFIRAETLRRYHNYTQGEALLKVHSQGVEDARSTMILIRNKFELGEMTVEEYNKALRLYTESSAEKVRSEQALINAKATLEEILGVKLEQIPK